MRYAFNTPAGYRSWSKCLCSFRASRCDMFHSSTSFSLFFPLHILIAAVWERDLHFHLFLCWDQCTKLLPWTERYSMLCSNLRHAVRAWLLRKHNLYLYGRGFCIGTLPGSGRYPMLCLDLFLASGEWRLSVDWK